MSADVSNAREIILQVLSERSTGSRDSIEGKQVLLEVARRLSLPTGGGTKSEIEIQHAVLTCWHDLFRMGLIAPGTNIQNPDLPWVHLTDAGRKALENLSRDPANPTGYLKHLASIGLSDSIVESYITEAILAYNSVCFKSAAVMAGAAVERLVELVRDELVAGLARQKASVAAGLNDWRYKTMRDSITAELAAKQSTISPQALKESFAASWGPFTEQPRRYRNDAGHPKSVDPITPEIAHSNLLVFPEFLKLVVELTSWIKANY